MEKRKFPVLLILLLLGLGLDAVAKDSESDLFLKVVAEKEASARQAKIDNQENPWVNDIYNSLANDWPLEEPPVVLAKTIVSCQNQVLTVERLANLRISSSETKRIIQHCQGLIVQGKEYVTALAYNIEERMPGFLAKMTSQEMSLRLVLGTINKTDCCEQTLTAQELQQLQKEKPANLYVINMTAGIIVKNAFFVADVEESNTSKETAAQSVVVKGKDYITTVFAPLYMVKSFKSVGKSMVKRTLKDVFTNRGVSKNKYFYIENLSNIKGAGIKNIVFVFSDKSGKETSKISFNIDEYESLLTEGEKVVGVEKSVVGIVDAINAKVPIEIDKRTSLVNVLVEDNCDMCLSINIDQSLAKSVKNSPAQQELIIKNLIQKDGYFPIAYLALASNPNAALSIRILGIDLDVTTKLSGLHLTELMNADENTVAQWRTEMQNLYATVPVESTPQPTMLSQISPGTVGDSERITKRESGMKGDIPTRIVTDINYDNPSPSLEKECAKFFFKDEQSPTLHKAVMAEINALKPFQGGLTIQKDSKYSLVRNTGRRGYYATYTMRYEHTAYGKKKWHERNVIYDVCHDRILTINDVFTPDAARDVESVAGTAFVNMAATSKMLILGFKNNGHLQTKQMEYKKFEEYFNVDFLQLVGYYNNQPAGEVFAGGEVLKAKEVLPNQPAVPGKEDGKVFDVVEQMPSFPGGPTAMFDYLSKNIKYPPVAEENGVQGRVIVSFVVERDGSITDVQVVKSVDPSLDKEALRVVKSMPRWIPGKQGGTAVRVKYTVPVTFRLTDPVMDKFSRLQFQNLK